MAALSRLYLLQVTTQRVFAGMSLAAAILHSRASIVGGQSRRDSGSGSGHQQGP